MKRPRIVSLLPSATEIVCVLGCGHQLVGRSHECDFPEEVRRLPVCTGAKIDATAGSGAIDREVKGLLEQSLSLYRVDIARLKELRPDFILTQAQCEVCAVNLPEVERALAGWTAARPQLLSLSPQRLADVWEDMRRVAQALGVADGGRDVLRGLKTRCVDVIEKACGAGRRPTVACIEWIDPLMAAGNWVPELVELAGGANLFGEAGRHSPWMSWEQLVEADPEVIVVMPCGFDLPRTRLELAGLSRKPEWPGLRAVKTGRVFPTDGSQFFNRPGPRLVDSLEILAELFHPEIFAPKHAGDGWAGATSAD